MSYDGLATHARSPEPGDILAGKYRVEGIIGFGGMGVVVSARHLTLEDRVAIKVLSPEATAEPEAVARFLREAKAVVRIKNEHVARVLDVGALDGGAPYMVMEYLEGRDLEGVLETRGALPVPIAVDYVMQGCHALAAAHLLGIVHRDIKPSNLFLTVRPDGTECVKVLDFGISKTTSPLDATQPDAGLTKTQSVMGTPSYMAPEQMRSSRRADTRTDVWGLGALLYELLTGKRAFDAKTIPELCAMILQDPVAPMLGFRPDIPPELDRVVMKCLEKKPDDRYRGAAELAIALAPFGTMVSRDMAEAIMRSSIRAANTPAHFPSPLIMMPDGSSGAAMSHAKTTNVTGLGSPRSRAPMFFALFSALTFGVMGLAFIAGWWSKHRRATTTATPTVSASVTSATVDNPTLPPPVTVLPEPPVTTTAVPVVSATPPASTPHPHGRTPIAPSARASASAKPPPTPATTTPPGLASSRYD